MAFLYPWGNTQQLNLDWILQKIKELEAGNGGAELNEVANALISATYSPSQAYDRSDIVYHDGKLYRANQAIPAPGETWTPAHWDEILLGDTVSNLVQYVAALSNDQIANSSSVSGTHTSDALDALKNAIDGLSFDSDDIANESNITGTDVTGALNTLDTTLSNEISSRQNDDLTIEKLTCASFENGATASRLYNVGDYIIRNGGLYKVIQTIAAGASFIVDTNLESTTAGVQLTYTQIPHFFTGAANIFLTSNNTVITSVEAARNVCTDSLYMVLNGNITNGMEIGTLRPIFRPYTSWAMLNLYALQSGAYLPIGCVWINSAGIMTVYIDTSISPLPSANYCFGSYVAYKDNS